MPSPRAFLSSFSFVAASLALSLMSACGGASGPADTSSSATSTGPGASSVPESSGPQPVDPEIELGKALYAQRCALCHGPNGEGYFADGANALSNPRWLSIASDELIRSAIARGRVIEGTPMPAFSKKFHGTLDDAQINAIVKLIRSWATIPPVDLSTVQVPAGVPERALALYDSKREFNGCVECHGRDGKGATRNNFFMSLNDPDFLSNASDAYIYLTLVDGRPGTPMKSYAHLNQRQLGDLVALIRSWARPVEDKPILPPPNDLENSILNPGGAEPEFTLRENKYVKVAEVYQQIFEEKRRVIILDAREPSDWIRRRIKGARNIPFYDAASLAPRLPKDAYIVAYCGCPHAASGALADSLKAAGFPRVAVLDEGFWIWEERGHPVAEANEQ